MFGIVRPCTHRLSEGLRTEWMAHLCGLCLALRSDHGQFARIATNYDGLIVSVLTEAQSARATGWRRTAGSRPGGCATTRCAACGRRCATRNSPTTSWPMCCWCTNCGSRWTGRSEPRRARTGRTARPWTELSVRQERGRPGPSRRRRAIGPPTSSGPPRSAPICAGAHPGGGPYLLRRRQGAAGEVRSWARRAEDHARGHLRARRHRRRYPGEGG